MLCVLAIPDAPDLEGEVRVAGGCERLVAVIGKESDVPQQLLVRAWLRVATPSALRTPVGCVLRACVCHGDAS